MPRVHKRKEDARRYGYDKDAMQKALEELKEDGSSCSIKMVAAKYGLNSTTLMNHLKNVHTGKYGRPSVLTPAEETVIVHALQKLGEWGLGLNREAVKVIVLNFLNNVGRKTAFNDGKPGNDWMLAFERRWKKDLTYRVGQPMPANRAYACNKAVVADFFEKLAGVFERLQLAHRPQNIFNVDETGFQTDVGSQKIYCTKGLKNPHKTVASSTKLTYTVQVCCSATGTFLPLYVVYKGLNLYNTWCQGGPDGTRFTCSPSGWMETAQFVEWFEKIFINHTKESEGPKLLILDGHSSHISAKVVELAFANQIELFCLPAHTSSIVQPLDVGV